MIAHPNLKKYRELNHLDLRGDNWSYKMLAFFTTQLAKSIGIADRQSVNCVAHRADLNLRGDNWSYRGDTQNAYPDSFSSG